MAQDNDHSVDCRHCTDAEPLGFDFSFAFQPIVRASTRSVISYEALARGLAGEPFGHIWAQVNDSNRYRFDQTCRVKAISLAHQLGLQKILNINFLPNAVYQPERCIRTTLQAARQYDFPIENIQFEVTEVERVIDTGHLVDIFRSYSELGFATAIDDFGAGYAGLSLLDQFQPGCIKVDRTLIDGVDASLPSQAIIEGLMLICSRLGIELLAEGVERKEEYRWLRNAGVDLFQGYYFARPAFEELPTVPEEVFDTE